MTKLRIAFDIGGVLSKYPAHFRTLCYNLQGKVDQFVLTDMHDKADVCAMLRKNGFYEFIFPDENIYTADYATHGEMCKAVLLKELKIDIFIDDFIGYTQWDSQLGDAPIRLLVQPDAFKPYWDEQWKCTGGNFGRRKFTNLCSKGDTHVKEVEGKEEEGPREVGSE